MDWTTAITDPAELRRAFQAPPDNRYRPIAAWWWTGERLDEERLLWQLDQLHAMGCGGVTPVLVGLGPGPQEPSRPERMALLRRIALRCRELGLGMVTSSPWQSGGVVELDRLLREDPTLRAEIVEESGRALPYGIDFGNPRVLAALSAPDSAWGEIDAAIGDLYGDPVVGMFEDELWVFAR